MASVYDKHGSPYWWMAIQAPGGRQNKSTGIPLSCPKGDAVHLARAVEACVKAGTRRRVDAKFYDRLLTSVLLAAGIDIPDEGQDITWSNWINKWTAMKFNTRNWSSTSLVKYCKHLDSWMTFSSCYNDDIRSTTKEVYELFLQSLCDRYSSSTVVAYIRTLSQCIDAAVAEGFADENHACSLNLPKSFPEGGKRPFILDEFQKIVHASYEFQDGVWAIPVLLGATLGLRINDACNRDWDDIHNWPDDPYFQFVPSKKKQIVRLPVPGPIIHQYGIQRHGPMVEGLAGKTTSHLSGLFAALMDDAGVKRMRISHPGVIRAQYDLGFHSLRYFSKTMQDRMGVPEAVSRQINNHDDPKVARGYSVQDVKTMSNSLERSVGAIYSAAAVGADLEKVVAESGN